MRSVRTFPGPWRVEVTASRHFVVKDATGFAICYIYPREDEALRGVYMTPAEAVAIAEAIAKLPELGRHEQIA
jgi:hypothetical protein